MQPRDTTTRATEARETLAPRKAASRGTPKPTRQEEIRAQRQAQQREPERQQRGGRDRMERGGFDRAR